MRPLRIAVAAAVLVGVGGSAVVITAAAQPGDLNGYMNTHREAVQEQLAATTDPVQQAAFEKELGAICSFLGDCPPESTTTTTVPPSTTTSVPDTTTTEAPTTTTVLATTTVPATTTTPAPTTTTTVAPSTTTTSIPSPTACTFSASVTVAFCDSFAAAAGNPATRTGDLDPVLWGVSRTNTIGNAGQGSANPWMKATLTGCGATVKVSPPNDVRICNGRLIAAVADGEGQAIVAAYPKQPFDFSDRTGLVVFDVSNDSQGPHAAWPEFWVTDKPVPAPGAVDWLPAQTPYAANSFGVMFTLQCANGGVGVENMMRTTNSQETPMSFTGGACVTKGSATGALNHVEIRVSQSRIEVWGTDAGSSALKLMATAANANLSFTRGLIWVENVHYNGNKFNSQGDHEFAFDNVGFDGPKTYRDMTFDVQDHNTTDLGWVVPVSGLHTVPVSRVQTPTAAYVLFNWFPWQGNVPDVRVNGGAWHGSAWPGGGAFSWRTIAVPVPLSEVPDGVATVDFRGSGQTAVSNVNILLVAAAPVP